MDLVFIAVIGLLALLTYGLERLCASLSRSPR
jgi:hypothetical protein